MLKQLTSCKQSKRTLCQTEGRTGNLYSPGRQIYRNDVRVRHSTYVFIDLHNYYVLLYIVKLVTRDHRKITTNFHTLTREACKLCKTSSHFKKSILFFFSRLKSFDEKSQRSIGCESRGEKRGVGHGTDGNVPASQPLFHSTALVRVSVGGDHRIAHHLVSDGT